MSSDFRAAFERMISGHMADKDIATHLQKFEREGVTQRELRIGAEVLRARMTQIKAPPGAMDIVGTGGDNLSTFNISTACCFVVAGAGITVAKHGNRAVSSKSGASDVLRQLGVKLDISLSRTQMCMEEARIGFLFAPNHHKAMGHVAKARAQLGTRTIFNRLGPLCNPANVERLLVGVYDNDLRKTYAQTLLSLDVKRALIVHGGDGMDEITTTAPTQISEIKDGKIHESEIAPQDFGLSRARLEDLRGQSPAENAQALKAVLAGNSGPYRDIVLLNAGAALYTAGKTNSIADGIKLAGESIDAGHARKALTALIEISNR